MKIYYWIAKWMWLLGVFPDTAQAMLDNQPEFQQARQDAHDEALSEWDDGE